MPGDHIVVEPSLCHIHFQTYLGKVRKFENVLFVKTVNFHPSMICRPKKALHMWNRVNGNKEI